MKRTAILWISAVSLCLRASVGAFTLQVDSRRAWSSLQTRQSPQTDDDDELFSPSRRLADSSTQDPEQDLTDLTPPSVNLARDSILFSENPSTQRNNSALDAWNAAKSNLPAFLTGAWPWRDLSVADKDPVGALYNIAMVRLPVVLVGILYGKNLIEGHPLVMDIGDGPFVMSPLIVIAVLGIILA
jgi:hypothetical protein